MSSLLTDEEDGPGGTTAIVRHSTLIELCSESAKLKSAGYMNLVSSSFLRFYILEIYLIIFVFL